MSSDDLIADLVADFPPVSAAFAYGSAMFGQRGYTDEQQRNAMLDLVFVVDDAASWHQSNLETHGAHYSGVSRYVLGSSGVARLQEDVGAGIYYNHAEVRGRLIKYGVISRAAFDDDLQHWTSLYVSGRFHKPVQTLKPLPAGIDVVMAQNVRAAVSSSLLLLPQQFDASRFLDVVCGLSYGGDVRMGVGERYLKPLNIAAGQRELLVKMYAAPLADAVGGGHDVQGFARRLLRGGEHDLITQETSWAAREAQLTSLPSNLQRTLLSQLSASGVGAETGSGGGAPRKMHARLLGAASEVWANAHTENAANQELRTAMRRSLSRIVRRSSLAQTVKGIVTAGATTSVMYAIKKMRKRSQVDAHGAGSS